MTTIYLTGLSGVGTTSALEGLKQRGYRTIDTDYGGYVNGRVSETGTSHYLDEEKMKQLLEAKGEEPLFISGCCDNQGTFYKDFDVVVLLKADLPTMLERIETRTNNDYGKTLEEREEILANYRIILPLLEKSSDVIIDTTTQTVNEVCNQLEGLL